jgi:anti-anti-sigma factor
MSPLPSASATPNGFVPPSPFACGWKSDGFESAWIHLGGELDLATLPLFRQTLREAQQSAGAVSIDLQSLEFIDCAALGVILDAHALARREGKGLTLLRGSGQVDRVLGLTGLLEQVEVVDLELAPAPGP